MFFLKKDLNEFNKIQFKTFVIKMVNKIITDSTQRNFIFD